MDMDDRITAKDEPLLHDTEPRPLPQRGWLRTLRLVLVVSVVSIGTSFQFGFGTGSLNNLDEVFGGQMKLWQYALVVSGFSIGGLMGSFVVAHVSLRFGRNSVLLATNAFVIASSALLMYGTAWPALMLGRVSIGLVAGIGSAVVPVYLAEVLPTAVQRIVGTAHQLGITGGCLCAYAVTTPSLSPLADEQTWRYVFVLPVLCSLVQCIVLPFCPESPAYLYRTVGSAAALRKLAELHAPTSIGGHIDALRAEADMGGGAMVGGGFSIAELLSHRKLRRHLLVSVVIQLSMQLSGIDAVYYYSTRTLRQAGVEDAPMATTRLGVLSALLTVVAIQMMDRAGRRTLLLCAYATMTVSYVALTLALTSAAAGVLPELSGVLAQLAMAGVITAFALGPGCIGWFVVAEIFPAYAVDAAMVLGVALNWLANWVVAFGFPLLSSLLGPSAWLLFAILALGFALFTYWYVPETRLLSTSEIHEELQQRLSGCAAGVIGALN